MPDLSTKIEKNQLHILSNAKLTPHLYGKMIVYLTKWIHYSVNENK